jgi:hypothetical protein
LLPRIDFAQYTLKGGDAIGVMAKEERSLSRLESSKNRSRRSSPSSLYVEN